MIVMRAITYEREKEYKKDYYDNLPWSTRYEDVFNSLEIMTMIEEHKIKDREWNNKCDRIDNFYWPFNKLFHLSDLRHDVDMEDEPLVWYFEMKEVSEEEGKELCGRQ